jgi:DNA-binding CsgD family transcriptional regulator/type II secretory pathway predicted ATPase ExeA
VGADESSHQGAATIEDLPAPVSTTCPALVGRSPELQRLRAALASAADGDGGAILIVGEAGVGKTRLIAEALIGSEAAGAIIVRTGCLEADLAEPYALVAQIAEVLDGIDLPFERAPEAARQARRVERELRAALQSAIGDRLLVLVAEDLHWSDQPSLNVLLGLAQRPGRCLLLMTCRPAPLTPALASFRAELNRMHRGAEHSLGPLSRAETVRMIRVILALDDPVPVGLLDEIMAVTEGVPFLIEEVLRSMRENGGLEPARRGWRRRVGVPLHVPGSLHQVIESRLLARPVEARVAELAAAIGQVPDIGLLQTLAGLDGASLATALRALVEMQILVVRPGGELMFRHALTREAILARLLTIERKVIHRAVAEAVEQDADASAATLAFHWSRAGDTGRAAPHALRAARQAAALHAHREAIGQYELALAGVAAPEAELLVAMGDHHAALSECEEAVSAYRRARSCYAAQGDAARVAEANLRIGFAYADQKRRGEAQQHVEAALAGLPIDHPERWRAGLLLALQLAAQGEYPRAEEALRRASCDSTDVDPLVRLRIDYELGGVRAVQGDWPALERAAQQVLDNVADDSDAALSLRHDASAALGVAAFFRGEMETSIGHHRACLEIAERRGVHTDQVLARWSIGMRQFYLGRWAAWRSILADVQALGFAWMAEVAPHFELWLDGRWEEASAGWYRSWMRLSAEQDLEFQVGVVRYAADVLLLLNRPEQALAMIETVIGRVREIGAISHEIRLVSCEVAALVLLGDARAETVCAAGLDLAHRLGARACEGLLLRSRAAVHRAGGRWQQAFADCEASALILEELDMAFELALTQREAGLLRLARGRKGDRESAARSLHLAKDAFARIGAGRLAAEMDETLTAAGLANRAGGSAGRLSPRERDVALLVAAGLSNRQVAERLYISEKTAAHHVGVILGKLGFGSRAEIAAYVASRGGALAANSRA